MNISYDDFYRALSRWAVEHGIRPGERSMPPGKAGVFNGLSITMNRDYAAEEKLYYFAHALGSIVIWSVDPNVDRIFDDLQSAKAKKQTEPAELDKAIDRFRAFEIESSELAVWLFQTLGFANAVAAYTNFMRADLESITQFHRRGRAPVWRTFFTRWNEEVRSGVRRVEPFHPQPMPEFKPRTIKHQEILQEQG